MVWRSRRTSSETAAYCRITFKETERIVQQTKQRTLSSLIAIRNPKCVMKDIYTLWWLVCPFGELNCSAPFSSRTLPPDSKGKLDHQFLTY